MPLRTGEKSFLSLRVTGAHRSAKTTEVSLRCQFLEEFFLCFAGSSEGCETWSMTIQLSTRLGAFDTWCLQKIFCICYTQHVTDVEVKQATGCNMVSFLYHLLAAPDMFQLRCAVAVH